jgi:integrase
LPSFIVLPKHEEKERHPFTDLEQAALWKVYESGDKRAAIPLLMIYTGMMPGEAQGLRVENINLEERVIVNAGMKTKVRKATPIVLANDILPLVEDLVANAQKSGYIWKRNEDEWYASYYAALEAAGCRKLTPYSCRHTTATSLAITEGIAPQTIKRVMRWSTTKMLDRYAHPEMSDALSAVDAIKKANE